MTSSGKSFRIVLAVTPYSVTRCRMLAGILEYAGRHCRWDVVMVPDADRVTPDTIRDRRLELASEALLASDSPVGEIVAGCGFRTRRVLERLFRARYGMSMPSLPGRTQDAARPEAAPPSSAHPQFRGQDARAHRRAKTRCGLSFFASMG